MKYILFTEEELECYSQQCKNNTVARSILLTLDSKSQFLLHEKDLEIKNLKNKLKGIKNEN